MKIYKISQVETTDNEYRDMHSAPEPEQGTSLDDLSDIYGDDIYSMDGERLYGSGEGYDQESLSIIRGAKGRPNTTVTIYRAVPDINKETNKKIKELNTLLNYHLRYKFFPVNNDIVNEIETKHINSNYSYDELQEKIIEDLNNQVDALSKTLLPQIKIEIGDWVTLSKTYAKVHGLSRLIKSYGAYRIIQKTVKAKDLYSEGNSLHEWGYNPS